ncbi:MAG: HypC/HybG/HupF family hydrogenase formation chaperone [Candidatus Lokiarchaeota archaeon]|nr:HypC/HybG/HupF family hydrogenase formation chaperone [Candidatus Lokiarchaeota archaeon]MCK4281755.1 HypC/HybG/HupF family hydrogenase formation chaperone [Candidatus Lokiarchaeota archaeon]
MCLAIPGKILEVNGDKANVDFNGVKRDVIIALVKDAKVGKYVLVHAGYAIELLNEEEAQETLKLWKNIVEEEHLDESLFL